MTSAPNTVSERHLFHLRGLSQSGPWACCLARPRLQHSPYSLLESVQGGEGPLPDMAICLACYSCLGVPLPEVLRTVLSLFSSLEWVGDITGISVVSEFLSSSVCRGPCADTLKGRAQEWPWAWMRLLCKGPFVLCPLCLTAC